MCQNFEFKVKAEVDQVELGTKGKPMNWFKHTGHLSFDALLSVHTESEIVTLQVYFPYVTHQ